MNKKILFNTIFIAISLSVVGGIDSYANSKNNNLILYENANVLIQESRDEYFESICKTDDGGYIAVGYTDAFDFDDDNRSSGIITKFNKYGEEEWTTIYDKPKYEYLNSVIQTSDGGYVAVGTTNSKFDSLPTYNYKGIAIKLDNLENIKWETPVDLNLNDYKSTIKFNSVAQMSNGIIVTVGNVAVLGEDSDDGMNRNFTALFAPNGKLLGYNSIFLGDTSSIITTSDNGVAILLNEISEANDINLYSSHIFKIGDDGEFYYSYELNDGNYIYLNQLKENNGFYYVVGEKSSYNGSIDAFIGRYDPINDEFVEVLFGGSNYDTFKSLDICDNGDIVAVGYSKSTDISSINKGGSDGIIVKYDKDLNLIGSSSWGYSGNEYLMSVATNNDEIAIVGYTTSLSNKGDSDRVLLLLTDITIEETAVKNAELSKDIIDIESARDVVNKLPESNIKIQLQDRLNTINLELELERKNVSANLDVYIKCENILLMSLNTNQITFDDFSGVEDMIKENAVNITINSSLPYQLSAYLPVEIQNSDKSNAMDKQILNIKENSEILYQVFANTTDKIVLKDNCPAGNDIVHGIDIKLKGGIAHQKDVYKTTIKFEAQQI